MAQRHGRRRDRRRRAAGLAGSARRGPTCSADRCEVTEIGFADEIAAAASLLMGQAAEARPVVLVRGLAWSEPASSVRPLVRPTEEDLFR